MADNQIKVKIATEEDLKGVKAVEQEIEKIKQQKIQLKIDAKKDTLNDIESEIKTIQANIKAIENVPLHLRAQVEDDSIDALKSKLKELEDKKARIELEVEDAELQQLKNEMQAIEKDKIQIELENQTAMQGLDQLKQGLQGVRQSAGEVMQVMGEALEASGRMENMETFLSMNIGADKAKGKLEEIRKVTDSLPGDDVTLQNLLSQAVVKDASMTADAMTQMGQASADYMASMQNFGKSATETQQDLMNYILAGNTAEIERSPILQAHIDKLKEGTTVQERSKLLQEALTAEGWNGISQQDTYNNKLQKFNDMLTRGQMNMGELFQEGTKGGMDFLLALDGATGGLVGMGFAFGGLVAPAGEFLMSLGQIGTGLSTLKGILPMVQGGLSSLSGAFSGLFSILSANPIILVVVAIAALTAGLIWAYQNVEWFHEAVDGLVSLFMGALTGAINWIMGLFNNFTSMLGLNTNNWIEALLGFIIFFLTLPLQLAIGFANMISQTLGFGDNFVAGLAKAGSDAVNAFFEGIGQMYDMVSQEFERIKQLVTDFINNLPQMVWDLGEGIIDSLKGALGIGSPGHMYYMLEGEFNRMDDLTKGTKFDTAGIGNQMVNDFNPNFGNGANSVTTTTTGNNITVNIDSVDNEERINQIVEAVEEALKFDNLTAGRTV